MADKKEQIFATIRTFKTKDIEAFGTPIRLKQLSAAAYKDIGLRVAKADPDMHQNVYFVIGGCFDPDTGDRIFDWSDAEAVNRLFVGDINRIAEQVVELNTASAETIEKN